MIQFQSVSKKYKGADEFALQDVSFQMKDGEFTFLVGPSGSGKSTIIKLLSAEEPITKGKIIANDYDLSALRKRQVPFYRRTVGVVYQDFRLIQSRTVGDNLAFVMRVVGIDSWFIKDRVDEVLDLVGLSDKKDRYPQELSGGEQQRVSIARALMNRPKVILADEPTGNLDPELSQEVMDLFVRVNKELNTTVMVVTHEKYLVNGMNKRVIYLDSGRVVRDHPFGKYDAEKGVEV
jgi:cell division transport system ATP-binding protein